MTTIEEQIWDYIDGNCNEQERLVMEARIASDADCNQLYRELSAVNQQLSLMETDEPPMAFNRRVMDSVAVEVAPVSLKTKVDRRIIYGIAAFFVIALSAILIYAVSQGNFRTASPGIRMPALDIDFSRFLHSTFIRIFLFTDLFIAFLYLDRFLARKKV